VALTTESFGSPDPVPDTTGTEEGREGREPGREPEGWDRCRSGPSHLGTSIHRQGAGAAMSTRATTGQQLVRVVEVAAATGYNPTVLADRGVDGTDAREELAATAEGLGCTVVTDWAGQPAVSWADAAKLYRHLTGQADPATAPKTEPEPDHLLIKGPFPARWLSIPGLLAAVKGSNDPKAGAPR
jgi:hypothetical protein